jgi:hypothetical protein
MLHEAQGLAVSPWGRHAEVASNIFFGVSALLMAQQDHGLVANLANATHQSFVITSPAITVQFVP